MLTDAGNPLYITSYIPCIESNTRLLTPSGYKNIKELSVDDYVSTIGIDEVNRQSKIKHINIFQVECDEETLPYLIPQPDSPDKTIKLSKRHLIFNNINKDNGKGNNIKWIHPFLANKYLQDTKDSYPDNKIEYYHVRLENYTTDHLILEGGLIVESLAEDTPESAAEYQKRITDNYKIENGFAYFDM